MAYKDEKLIIRISPKLKKHIENTAKKHNKTVSDFVRDVLSNNVDRDEEQTIYMTNLRELQLKLERKKILQTEINNYNDDEIRDELLKTMGQLNQEIYVREQAIKDYLNGEEE